LVGSGNYSAASLVRLVKLPISNLNSDCASAPPDIRGALAADDALKRQGLATRFRARETPDWKKHAADLESEMLRRGMTFNVIDWSEYQAPLPFER
jgi:hypothetical protein